jgi:hypothetical protein
MRSLMVSSSSVFQLKIQQVEQTCLFELSWGQGQRLAARLQYPELLGQRYGDWQRIYLSFYKTPQLPLTALPESDNPLFSGELARSVG